MFTIVFIYSYTKISGQYVKYIFNLSNKCIGHLLEIVGTSKNIIEYLLMSYLFKLYLALQRR